MNELAQVVHDFLTLGPEAGTRLDSELSAEERGALEDLRVLLTKSPSELAGLLVGFGPTATWFGPPNLSVTPTGRSHAAERSIGS